jgi:hypothetical protein
MDKRFAVGKESIEGTKADDDSCSPGSALVWQVGDVFYRAADEVDHLGKLGLWRP